VQNCGKVSKVKKSLFAYQKKLLEDVIAAANEAQERS
jgi:hypothetical protein